MSCSVPNGWYGFILGIMPRMEDLVYDTRYVPCPRLKVDIGINKGDLVLCHRITSMLDEKTLSSKQKVQRQYDKNRKCRKGEQPAGDCPTCADAHGGSYSWMAREKRVEKYCVEAKLVDKRNWY